MTKLLYAIWSCDTTVPELEQYGIRLEATVQRQNKRNNTERNKKVWKNQKEQHKWKQRQEKERSR